MGPLVAASEGIQTDRILNLIDVLADSEGRMKWASNKRLHFEIGIIKAIQSLNDARISDVIKALAGAGSLSDLQTPSETPQSTPTASCLLLPSSAPAAPNSSPRPSPATHEARSYRPPRKQASLNQRQKEASTPSSTQPLKQLPSQPLR